MVDLAIAEGMFEVLKANDQLRKEQMKGNVFQASFLVVSAASRAGEAPHTYGLPCHRTLRRDLFILHPRSSLTMAQIRMTRLQSPAHHPGVTESSGSAMPGRTLFQLSYCSTVQCLRSGHQITSKTSCMGFEVQSGREAGRQTSSHPSCRPVVASLILQTNLNAMPAQSRRIARIWKQLMHCTIS